MVPDLRLALRNLARQPVFSLVAVATLALGIGSTTALFSVVDTILLRPMPYPDGDRMRFIWLRPQDGAAVRIAPSLALAEALALESHAFESIEYYVGDSRVTMGAAGAESVAVLQIRPSIFRMLQARPRLGRLLGEDDVRPDAPDVALISHELWTRVYGRSPAVLDRDIRLDDRLHRIVGVMAPGFRVPPGEQDVWIPLRPVAGGAGRVTRATVLGVLAEDARLGDAAAELKTRAAAAADSEPLLARGFQPVLVDPSYFAGTVLRRSAVVLFAAVSLLLALACTNVTALLLTRNSSRAREIAVRRALGATRARLLRFLLADVVVLSVAAGAGGILLAAWMLDLAGTYAPPGLIPPYALRIEPAALMFAVGISLLVTLLVGILPVLAGTRGALTDAMRGDTHPGGTHPGRHRTRQGLAAAEVALAVILLAGASLLAKTFFELQRVPLGFDPRNTIGVTVELPESRYAEEAAREQFFESLAETAKELPDVQGVARATDLLPAGGIMFGAMRVEGRQDPPPHGPSTVSSSMVSDEYFGLMRIPVRRGRTFAPQDSRTGSTAVVINERLARVVWGAQNPIGQRIAFSSGTDAAWATVIGIVGDVRSTGLRGGGPGDYQVYYSLRQSTPASATVIVRTATDPAPLGPLLRARVRQLDPLLPVSSITTGSQQIAAALARERFNALLLGGFALVGLTLAATGIYGMLAMYVGSRRHEIGVRLALGASSSAVAALVVRQSAWLTLCGVALGLPGALLLARFMDQLLYETRSTDPIILATVTVTIAAVSVLATAAPVRRAVRVEPAVVLRGD